MTWRSVYGKDIARCKEHPNENGDFQLLNGELHSYMQDRCEQGNLAPWTDNGRDEVWYYLGNVQNELPSMNVFRSSLPRAAGLGEITGCMV